MLETKITNAKDHQAHNTPYWWQREDLYYANKRLQFCGWDLSELVSSLGTPAFIYSTQRVHNNIRRLIKALKSAGITHRIFYAMKANRYPPLLTYLKTTGLCGIDACSPKELLQAIACGFHPSEISYTATSGDDGDFNILAKYPQVRVNCDSMTAIAQLGERCPGRTIGLRINPGCGISYGDKHILSYSGPKTTKFGIYSDNFNHALKQAKQFNLSVRRIHFHTGCGYLTPQLSIFNDILGKCCWFLKQVDDLQEVNIGGGLGVPHKLNDETLDLDTWVHMIQKNFSPFNVEIAVEPGDYIVKDSGILMLTVTYRERRQNAIFLGVNGGFNLAMEPAFYGLPCEPVACCLPDSGNFQQVTIVGNINEALDVWAEQIQFPEIGKGESIALLNAGGYAAAMSSNHCLRGECPEYLLF